MNEKPQTASTLVIAKSSRLQALREQASKQAASVTTPDASRLKSDSGDSDLLVARQLLDQRLQTLLASMPAGKQNRLFKIRFGYEPEQIKQLSLKQAFKVLQISHQLPTKSQRIAELNYNGDTVR